MFSIYIIIGLHLLWYWYMASKMQTVYHIHESWSIMNSNTALLIWAIAAQLAFLSLKYSRLGQSCNLTIMKRHLLKGTDRDSSGNKAIFRHIFHTQNIVPLFNLRCPQHPFALFLMVLLSIIALKCVVLIN